MEDDNKKPYKIKDVTRAIKKAVVAGTLEEVRAKAAEKFGRTELPNIHLDSDGTEVDDEDYFQTLEPNAELIAVFPGEQWIDLKPSETSIAVQIQDNPKSLSSSSSSRKDEEPSDEPQSPGHRKHLLNPSETKPSGSRDPSPKRPRGSRSATDKDDDDKLENTVDEMVIIGTEQTYDQEVVRSMKNDEDMITVDK